MNHRQFLNVVNDVLQSRLEFVREFEARTQRESLLPQKPEYEFEFLPGFCASEHVVLQLNAITVRIVALMRECNRIAVVTAAQSNLIEHECETIVFVLESLNRTYNMEKRLRAFTYHALLTAELDAQLARARKLESSDVSVAAVISALATNAQAAHTQLGLTLEKTDSRLETIGDLCWEANDTLCDLEEFLDHTGGNNEQT